MSALYPQNWMSYLGIASVFLRLMAFFLLVPGFSHKTIPVNVKVIFALSLSLVLYPLLKSAIGEIPETWGAIAFMAMRESAIGFLLGFVCYITFEAIHLAAQFTGYQMGFGTAGLIDPANQSHESLLVPLHSWLAIMVLFFTDFHHELLRLFILSFTVTQKLQLDSLANENLMKLLVGISSKLFALAIQMGAPFTLLILSCNAAMGILSRLMPQMNVMLFSFPVTILLGFGGLYLLAPEILEFLTNIMGEMSQNCMTLLKTL